MTNDTTNTPRLDGQDESWSFVKVRFEGDKAFRFLSGEGSSRLAIYASIFHTRAKAIACAEAILADERNAEVVAVAVMQDKKRVFHKMRAGHQAPRRLTKRDRKEIGLLDEAEAFLDQITDATTNAEAIRLADLAITRVSWLSGGSNTPEAINQRADELLARARAAWREAKEGHRIAA